MRENDIVVMNLPERFDIREFATDAYEFKAKSRKRVIRDRQKRQFEALKKCGALTHYYRHQNVCVQRVCFSKEQAADWVIRTAGDLLLREGFTPERVFVGRKQFQELAMTVLPGDFNGRLGFALDLRYTMGQSHNALGTYSREIRWMNINIEVIPWMDGVLVI